MDQKPNIRQVLFRIILFLISLVIFNIILSRVMAYLVPGEDDEIVLYASIAANFFSSIIAVYLFCRFLDKRTIASLGVKLIKPFDGTIGLLLALVILGSGTLVLVTSGHLRWRNIHFSPLELTTWLILMGAVALAEELSFRGYILNNLLAVMPKWWALVVSAIIFAAFHGYNPGMALLPLLNIFLGGILLGVNYIYTRNLWFGILFHMTWNYYQGPMLGYRVSGIQPASLLKQEISGNAMVTGGNFGFEGSILYSILTLVSIVSLAWIYEKKLKPAMYQ